MRSNAVAFAAILMLIEASLSSASGDTRLLRTPNSGIQPQAAVDASGVLHLVYYKGNSEHGDIFYVRRLPGQTAFSDPIQANQTPGSAMAIGTIRGAQMAIGKNGRVHLVWNGMGKGATKVVVGGREVTPLLYTRLNDEGTAFEPERNVISTAAGLDGGSSVAADREGNVYVVWHARKPGGSDEESDRAVFVAHSLDGGKTFQKEVPALSQPTGVCPCCGLKAFADHSGAVYVLFRSAAEISQRDALLLVSKGSGKDFVIAHRDPWEVSTCPMSSASLTETTAGVLAAWETAGQVYCATVDPRTLTVTPAVCPPGKAPRKHPSAVANSRGETLLVWTEVAGWGKTGKVGWQIYGVDGASLESGIAEGVAPCGFATGCTTTNGGFLIIY